MTIWALVTANGHGTHVAGTVGGLHWRGKQRHAVPVRVLAADVLDLNPRSLPE